MRSTLRTSGVVIAALAVVSCTKKGSSNPGDTNVPHSSVKRQSIGNCWTYAVVAFIEAQEMRSGSVGEFSNYSESYMTYRHLEEALTEGLMDGEGVQTGGGFDRAMSLIDKYGLMREADFIPSEATSPMSNVQKQAIDAINRSLKQGKLKSDKTAATIRAELDAAFGVQVESLKGKVIRPENVKVVGSDGKATTAAGRPVTLKDYMLGSGQEQWTSRQYDSVRGEPGRDSILTQVPYPTSRDQGGRLLRATKLSLNRGHPALLSWFVEFKANEGGVFDTSILSKEGYEGHSGYHLTALEDYTASGFNPDTGLEFYVGEGPVSDAEASMAADNGEIRSLITKNSWGSGFDRDDRSFYLRDGEPGYHRLEMKNYLLTWMWNSDTHSTASPTLGLQGVAVPKALY